MAESERMQSKELKLSHDQEISAVQSQSDARLKEAQSQAQAREHALEKEWMSKLASLQNELDSQKQDNVHTSRDKEVLERELSEAKAKAVKDLKVGTISKQPAILSLRSAQSGPASSIHRSNVKGKHRFEDSGGTALFLWDLARNIS